jgi:crotonobetainyl-CoA:carnitine CoA-transferase CaiB-like acyl-CoA transferase
VRLTELSNGRGLWTVGRMAAFSRSRVEPPAVVPGLGEHSVELLLEAGCSEDEIARLIETGTVRTGGPYTIG